MSENYEADVSEVVYAGPHCVERGIYEIEVKVEPAPGASSGYVTLRFRPRQATFLAHLLQSNPPQVRAHDDLIDLVAGHDT
jgi:hypothetical protein